MKYLLLPLLLLSLVSCGHRGTKTGSSEVVIGKTLKAYSYGSIYFSAQPTQEDLLGLKENGFSAVINLREKKEKNYSEAWERELVQKTGIAYYNIPFSMKDELTDSYIDQVTSKVVKHRKDGKVLVHCSSGNRVGIWIGGHFKKDHGQSSEEALKTAKSMGLQNPKAEEKLKAYLK